MKSLLELDGFSVVPQTEQADIYVVNTCTVTAKSDYRSRLAVRKSLGLNDHALIVFTGCYAQNQPGEVRNIPGLGLLLGNADKLQIVSAIRQALDHQEKVETFGKPMIQMSDINARESFTTLPITEFQGKTKAFLKVQTGCDEKCSFCTVVHARGKSISDSRVNILRNTQRLIESGFQEITLSGINLGTWGMDFNPTQKFSSLVEDILNLEGTFRVRISSINPMEIDDRLIELMSFHHRLCPHLHIPLQSGDDEVLARMRRNYNAAQYRAVVEKAKNRIPDLGLGADVIVGFPGETEKQFFNTRKLIESLPFSYLHVFTYSPRPDTLAHCFGNPIPGDVGKDRNAELTQLAREKSRFFRNKYIGQTLDVLAEQTRETGSDLLKGHSQNYIPVTFSGDDSLMNRIVSVRVESIDKQQVIGCFLPSP